MANVFTNIATAATQTALQQLKDKFFNPAITQIGVIKEISYRDKKFFLTVELLGLEGNDIEVCINSMEIAPDAGYVEIKDFDSNRLFAKNALNMFAAKKYMVPDKGMVRTALKTAKKVLGL